MACTLRHGRPYSTVEPRSEKYPEIFFCAVFLQVSDGDSESTFRPRVKVPLSTREVDNPDEPVLDRA